VAIRDGRDAAFRSFLSDGLFWGFVGALLGGRLGYALLYMPEYFLRHLAELVFPVEQGIFLGFFGMSFFGGLIGATLALWIFSYRSGRNFLEVADYYALIAPIGIFFGRVGNFFNGELYGRVTGVPWGMYFPLGGAVLRHPSQIYEALLEGVVLFFLMRIFRRRISVRGAATGFFLFCYGAFRFFAEYFREPDFGAEMFFGCLTPGQLYSILLILSAGWFLFSIRRRESAILDV
jgi:phosphatidylglycerol:prolipoprotein diacylglycerol transferase